MCLTHVEKEDRVKSLALSLSLLGVAVAAFGAPAIAPVKQDDWRIQRLLDLRGRIHLLAENERRGGTAFVFLSPGQSDLAAEVAALNDLAKSSDPQKVAVFGVVADPSVRRAQAATLTAMAEAPVLFDATGELAEWLDPREGFPATLIDAAGKIVFRGLGGKEGIGAAAAKLAKGESLVAAKADGKPLVPARVPAPATFAREIAPILLAQCAECHRAGQVAPFSLLTFDDASKRARYLADVTSQRQMPPWRAEADYGHFVDERRLPERQVALLRQWADVGAPKGDDADTPPPPTFPDGWRLGTPDLVVEVPAPYEVPADGPDIFQHFVLPIEIPESKTLLGFEFRPSNPRVAHHAVIFLDTSGQARELDAQTPEPGYRTSGSVGGGVTAMVGVWTPGNTPRFYPKGIGVRLAAKADLVLQLHLHPSGKKEFEQSKVALYFSDKPAEAVRKQDMLLMGSLAIDIPAGKDRHEIRSSLQLPIDVTLLSVFPHLHLIGKEMKVTATLPDGKPMPLIWIKDWKFYWQDTYMYREPVKLPKGTKIDVVAAYDNSTENPYNPSKPPRRVLFGNGSSDEMCFAFFQIVTDDQRSMMRMAPALMQSFLVEWRKANIDPEAREKIIDEAGKLFGRRSTQMLRTLLSTPNPNKPSG